MLPFGVNVTDNEFHYIVGCQNASVMFLFIAGVEKEVNGNMDAINYTLEIQ